MNSDIKDPIKNPAHYTQGQYECWDAMEDLLGRELVNDFCIGCAFKYIWREDLKNSSVEDIEKAIVYLNKYAELNELSVNVYKTMSIQYVQFYPYYKSHKCEQSVMDYFLLRGFECLIHFRIDCDLDPIQRCDLLIESLANLNAWVLIQNEGDI